VLSHINLTSVKLLVTTIIALHLLFALINYYGNDYVGIYTQNYVKVK